MTSGDRTGEVFAQCAFATRSEGASALQRLGRALAGHAGKTLAWRGTALATHGRRALLWLTAESPGRVRSALGPLSDCVEAVWAGTVVDPPSTGSANVVVERTCDPGSGAGTASPPHLGSGDWCQRAHQVRLVRRLVSRDGRRAVLLYAAPDAESVRMAERHAGGHVDAIWSFEWLPADG